MHTQLQLNVPIPIHRALVPAEACLVLLDCDMDELQHRIQGGQLPWAWDIRGPEATGRGEYRVWRDSLLLSAAGHPAPEGLQDHEVLSRIFPHGRQTLRSTEIQRALSASQSHVQHLIDSGALTACGHGGEGEERPLRGPNAYVLVTRESFNQFLRTRRVS